MRNIITYARLFGYEPGPELFFEAWPQSEITIIIRLAYKLDETCAYHKFESKRVISGGIIMWHGLLANIPDEYALCDGTNGTPDLREKFVRGSANGVDPGGGGGSVNHNHDFVGNGHSHVLAVGANVAAGTDLNYNTNVNPAVGTTDNEDGRPPFYDVAYIMKR